MVAAFKANEPDDPTSSEDESIETSDTEESEVVREDKRFEAIDRTPCVVHTLQLVVNIIQKDASVNRLLSKVRVLVNLFRKSSGHLSEFPHAQGSSFKDLASLAKKMKDSERVRGEDLPQTHNRCVRESQPLFMGRPLNQMPRGKSYRRSQAVKRRLETQRTLNVEPQQLAIAELVLLVGASHLRSIADGIVAMPEGELSFGVMSTPGAAAADLRAEFLSAVLPRKPDAVLLQAPSNNLTSSSTIQEAGADFSKLLASVCSQHTNVVVTDFTPRLNIDLNYQQHLRQEYHRVAASMGVKYFSVVEYFPLNNLELWCRDGVHLSDTVGMPILAQLLWMASCMFLWSHQRAPCSTCHRPTSSGHTVSW
nr:PREDICTED: uncharacterized protein LOC103364578 [Stegastes partitus]